MKKKCPMCKSEYFGRSDKKFCSVKCKSLYHYKLEKVTSKATKRIDKILHRNRSILLELMGKTALSKKVPLTALVDKKFNFKYITKFYVNNRGKTLHHVYDFRWMEFSDEHVMIYRTRK